MHDEKKPSLPCLLSAVFDSVGIGAVLSDPTGADDVLAMIVERIDLTGETFAIRGRKAVIEGEKLTEGAADYKVFEIKQGKLNDWLVLSWGDQRYELIP